MILLNAQQTEVYPEQQVDVDYASGYCWYPVTHVTRYPLNGVLSDGDGHPRDDPKNDDHTV